MIQIAINSTFLDVDKGLTIPMEEAFAFDEFLSIPGEHSWKFSLPKTPTNRRAFAFADVPDVIWDPATSYPCTIYLDGRVFKSGKLFIEQDSATAFDVYFVGTVGALKETLKGVKINELDQWFEVGSIGNMFAYAKDIATTANAPVVFFEVYMPNGDFPLTFLNKVDDTRTSTGNWEGFEQTGVNLLVPFVFLRRFWQTLTFDYGFTYNSAFLEDAEIDSLVFYNNKPLNLTNSAGEFLQSFPNKIEARNHVPDSTVEEFLVEFAKLFNLFIFYDDLSKVLTIIPRKDLLNRPRVLWNNKLVDYRTVFEEAKTYSYKYVVDDAELTASEDWAGTLEGINGPSGSEVVESKVATLGMWDFGSDGEWHEPLTTHRIGENPGIRLLFYRGLQNTYSATAPGWGPVPLGSSDIRYTSGFNYALTWRDAAGLYSQWWQPWENTAGKGRTLKLTLKLTEADLLEFDPANIYVIEGWKCLVKKLEYELGEKEVLAEVEVLKF